VGDSIGNWTLATPATRFEGQRHGPDHQLQRWNAVLFDDTATGTTNINLTTTLQRRRSP